MQYLIGTDIGTSGTKTVLMNTKGELLAQDLQEYDVLTPHPRWAEQWPSVWLDAAKRSIANTVDKAGVDKRDIAGLCISGLYGGSGIPLNADMNPVRPCLIWMDRRAEAQSEWVQKHIDLDKLRRITKNGTDPYYGYLKILWIKDNEPENWEKIKLFLPPNNYVAYCLTGQIAIDYSAAGNIGGIFDMNQRCWSDELMAALGIPRSMMPDSIVESSAVIGGLTSKAACELHLQEGTPVCAGGVDCGVATLGLGVLSPGNYSVAIGTSMCAALIHKSNNLSEDLIHWPYVWQAKDLTYSFGGGATAGAVVKWFRDQLARLEKQAECSGGENAYAVLDREAEKIAPGSDGVIVLPYFMGERSPLWDSHAKGVIFGLSLAHTRAHLYRAFLESVAFSLRHTMDAAGQDIQSTILLAGGVCNSKLWRQIFADVTGHSVLCPIHSVEANLGDVMLAGLGTGVLTLEDVRHWQVFDAPVHPNAAAHDLYDRYYKIYRELYVDMQSTMKKCDAVPFDI